MNRPKRVLVVGGTSGIGEAIAEHLGEVFPDLSVGVPWEDFETIMYPGGETKKVMKYDLDVRLESSIKGYLRSFGPYEYIVYTPGVNKLNYVELTSMRQLQDDFTVNAFGFARLLGIHSEMFGKEALLSAVAITSDAARNPMRGSMSYCSSKAALEMIIRNIAREWMPHTRVNGVAPAIVEGTPMTQMIDESVPGFRGWTPEEAKAYEKTQLPMGRRVLKEEVAEVVANVLFGPKYQTGSIVHVSGGK